MTGPKLMITQIVSSMLPTTDKLEAIRIFLGFGLVITNVLVFYGVYLESERFSQAKKAAGWRLLVRSLALEAALAFFLLVTDTTISNRQKEEIAVLEARIAPRRLAPDAMVSIANTLGKFAGKGIRLESYNLDLEAQVLGIQIANVLESAQIETDQALSQRASDTGIIFGIHIFGENEELKNTLADAFYTAGIQTYEDKIISLPGMLFNSSPRMFKPDATIFIGVKPLPNVHTSTVQHSN